MVKYSLIKTYKLEQKITSSYEFNLEFMGGDCDFYDHVSVTISEDDPYLLRFVEFVKNCQGAYTGKYGDEKYQGHKDDYSFVPDYYMFVEDDEGYDEEGEPLYPDVKFTIGYWPANWDHTGNFSLWTFDVRYIDKNGQKWNVQIKENK